MVEVPDVPTLEFNNEGTKLVFFMEGGSLQIDAAVARKLKRGDRVISNRHYRTVDRIEGLAEVQRAFTEQRRELRAQGHV